MQPNNMSLLHSALSYSEPDGHTFRVLLVDQGLKQAHFYPAGMDLPLFMLRHQDHPNKTVCVEDLSIWAPGPQALLQLQLSGWKVYRREPTSYIKRGMPTWYYEERNPCPKSN